MKEHSAEADEVARFLAAHPPFASLPPEALAQLVRHCRISYHRRGSFIIRAQEENHYLSVVRSGAVELRLGGTELNARLGEGECFGYPSLIRNAPTQNEVLALEDCLLYRVERATFLTLRGQHEAFRSFFETDEAARLRRAVAGMAVPVSGAQGMAEDLTAHGPVSSLIRRSEVICGHPDMPIGEAARLMSDQDVSTLPVRDGETLAGIITDKDLRRRVLAKGLDMAVPLAQVMTPRPVTVTPETPMLTALLMMADLHIHHLPVLDGGGRLAGVISSGDILARLGSNAMHIAKQVQAAPDAAGVALATAQLPQALTGLVAAGVDADHVSRYVSTIGEGAHRRLLEQAEAQFGPPPVPYALVCFGSLARSEQALGSDQDNGFILGKAYDPAQHGRYFEQVAQVLCDGLNGAGYRYCPGNIMATNPDYRCTAADWEVRFRRWIESPQPQAILESGIFFDMRALAGDGALVDGLRDAVFGGAQGNRIFLSFIARAAASTAVPLGFFRNFLLQKDADEGEVLDLKRQAIAPIVDLARCHALATGVQAANTLERLEAARAAGSLTDDAARDLAACFTFVCDARFRHQAQQITRGQTPSNKLDPASLSRFEREHLRDAFRLIRQQLDRLRSEYAGGLL